MPRMHSVVRGTGTPKDRDEVVEVNARAKDKNFQDFFFHRTKFTTQKEEKGNKKT